MTTSRRSWQVADRGPLRLPSRRSLSGANVREQGDRRNAMIWMLHETGVSQAAIARAGGIGAETVRQAIWRYEHRLMQRMQRLQRERPGPAWLQRLRAAGAL